MNVGTVTRRQALLAASGGLLWGARNHSPELSLEGYIWQNYAAREKKSLADALDEVFPTARYGGFSNIELSDSFFSPVLKDRVLQLTRANGLLMPSVYVGGGMHEDALADRTIARALEVGALCREFDCHAILNNPDTKPKSAAKTDDELSVQAKSLNRMGETLNAHGFQFRVHHHTAEMADNAREWRHILRNTDPQYVSLCVDVEHAQHGGMDPVTLLREAGSRVTELHLRNKRHEVLLETFDDGDIDYHKIAAVVHELGLNPLIVIELAYHDDTVITRSLGDDIRVSRINATKIFSTAG
jgi:inosose dehydratase